ncbi:MAG TPA: ferrochelatase, partial [Longimicrobiales bacterium]|nr:ferrochelatase [Longimicrobiales bacterium]
MSLGVLLVNFGEPDEPTLEKVTSYLERIFLQNAPLEAHAAEAALARTRQLARERAPGLLEEYEEIGGSPLNAQAAAQADAFGRELRSRGIDASVYSAFQFTDPSIRRELGRARADGVTTVVAIPGYPMCGVSTTVAALREVKAGLEAMGWDPRLISLSGWHHHPDYLGIWRDHVRAFMADRSVDLGDPDTILYFSVHGTPLKYLQGTNRYDRYVFEQCRDLAEALEAPRYAVGFQNHANRGIPWTQPENEDRIRELAEKTLVVVPISFMKEQSETLAELDHELTEFVEGLGKRMYRVPVPHDHPHLVPYLADLLEDLL